MPQQQQGPCFLVMGIVLMVVGFWWFWPLAVMGGIFFIIGICVISQEANKAKAQTQPAQPVSQLATQPVSQPVAQPAPAPVTETARFCPHCGAKTTGSYCSECGSEID